MSNPNASINPVCAACGEPIGSMPLDIYVKAVEYRGERLLCPECREHRCDCCGWFKPSEITRKVVDANGKFMGLACETCFIWVIADNPIPSDFPNFRCTHGLNLGYVRFINSGGEIVPSLVVEELL